MEAIFSCLNLKFDDGFLLYSMHEVFNKTGHGLSGIIIAWAKFKPVLHPEFKDLRPSAMTEGSDFFFF